MQPFFNLLPFLGTLALIALLFTVSAVVFVLLIMGGFIIGIFLHFKRKKHQENFSNTSLHEPDVIEGEYEYIEEEDDASR
jgi:Flp pilus assembly protein TadB